MFRFRVCCLDENWLVLDRWCLAMPLADNLSTWTFLGEGVPDWPYYPVLAKFLEGRGDFGDSYDAGSHSYTEPEARPGASHHHPGAFSLTHAVVHTLTGSFELCSCFPAAPVAGM